MLSLRYDHGRHVFKLQYDVGSALEAILDKYILRRLLVHFYATVMHLLDLGQKLFSYLADFFLLEST